MDAKMAVEILRTRDTFKYSEDSDEIVAFIEQQEQKIIDMEDAIYMMSKDNQCFYAAHFKEICKPSFNCRDLCDITDKLRAERGGE